MLKGNDDGMRGMGASPLIKSKLPDVPMGKGQGVIVEEGSRYEVTELLAPTICSRTAVWEVTGGERLVRSRGCAVTRLDARIHETGLTCPELPFAGPSSSTGKRGPRPVQFFVSPWASSMETTQPQAPMPNINVLFHHSDQDDGIVVDVK